MRALKTKMYLLVEQGLVGLSSLVSGLLLGLLDGLSVQHSLPVRHCIA